MNTPIHAMRRRPVQRLAAPASPAQALARLARAACALAARNSALALTLLTVAALCGLQVLALMRAPTAWLPASIDVELSAGDSIQLGQRELAAPQADRRHLSLRRDAGGDWRLRNLSGAKQVTLLRDAAEERLGSATIAGMQRFQVDGARFEVLSADARTVRFTRDGHEWRYDGAVLYRDGRQQENCPEAHTASRLLSFWNRLAPLPLTIARPLSFGGNLYCDNRLGLPLVTPGAAQLARMQGRLQLAAANPDGDRAAVLASGSAGTTDLRAQEASLRGVSAIIVGHTRLHVAADSNRLTLTPSLHITLFGEPELKLPQGVRWQWQQRALWHGSPADALWMGIALGAVAMVIGMVLRRVPHHPQAAAPWSARIADGAAWTAAAALLATGLAALVAQRAGYAPSAATSLLLGSAAMLMWLALPGRLSMAGCAGIVLLAIGLLAQLELGLGAPESSWLRYYQKSAAMLAIGTGLGGLLRLWAARRLAHGVHLPQRGIEWLLATFAAVALAGLAAQVLWGDEGGVFDLQPVELAKLALTALSAHCLALRFHWHNGPQRLSEHGARWLQLIAPALLFLALLGLALVQVDDFSPLVLLLLWSGVVALAYACAARNWVLAALLLALALLATGAVAGLRLAGSDDLVRWGFYADRFLVWLNPAEHPHTGQQLLQGARAIGEGGWLGADHWLGLRTLGLHAGAAVQIPAVQDDFAASFFLNRHGLVGALLLWLVQAAFLAGLVHAAVQAHRSGTAARNYRHAWLGRFRYFALCGGAAFVLGHFLLSWGTNLAIFPIMGQPMSFLSAGGSHLLFFLCPLLTFVAISTEGV